jgi:hypothetical protein
VAEPWLVDAILAAIGSVSRPLVHPAQQAIEAFPTTGRAASLDGSKEPEKAINSCSTIDQSPSEVFIPPTGPRGTPAGGPRTCFFSRISLFFSFFLILRPLAFTFFPLSFLPASTRVPVHSFCLSFFFSYINSRRQRSLPPVAWHRQRKTAFIPLDPQYLCPRARRGMGGLRSVCFV